MVGNYYNIFTSSWYLINNYKKIEFLGESFNKHEKKYQSIWNNSINSINNFIKIMVIVIFFLLWSIPAVSIISVRPSFFSYPFNISNNWKA